MHFSPLVQHPALFCLQISAVYVACSGVALLDSTDGGPRRADITKSGGARLNLGCTSVVALCDGPDIYFLFNGIRWDHMKLPCRTNYRTPGSVLEDGLRKGSP